MENVAIHFNLTTEEILFGVYVSKGEAEDPIGNVEECLIVSIGLLLFSIDIVIRNQ